MKDNFGQMWGFFLNRVMLFSKPSLHLQKLEKLFVLLSKMYYLKRNVLLS